MDVGPDGQPPPHPAALGREGSGAGVGHGQKRELLTSPSEPQGLRVPRGAQLEGPGVPGPSRAAACLQMLSEPAPSRRGKGDAIGEPNRYLHPFLPRSTCHLRRTDLWSEGSPQIPQGVTGSGE